MFSLTLPQRRLSVAVLFSLSLLFFIDRGAYRALRESRTGDFATIYAASRCWMYGENPYDRGDLRRELIQSGVPAALIREQDQHASLYLIPAMPFVATFAWLPWTAANVTWCLLSLGCFAASLVVLLQNLQVSSTSKWATASVCLFFSPTYVGILNGNPSVFSISLTILALHFARQDRSHRNGWWISALLFSITLCVKPQVALCPLLAFLLWKCWRPLLVGSVVAAFVTVLATLQASSSGQNWAWWFSLQQNFVHEASPGGLVDPSSSSPYASEFLNAQTLSYLLTRNAQVGEGLVLALMVGMIAVYFYLRKRDPAPDSQVDVAFLAAITLQVTYHRYYDGQLLLVLIPAAVHLSQAGRRRAASVLAVCFALVAFPLQSIFEKLLGAAAMRRSFVQLVLLRHEPVAILAVALVLSLRWQMLWNANHSASK